ncbi:MAG: hypothetical protein WCM76_02260 [Bacteroidota bacterium]
MAKKNFSGGLDSLLSGPVKNEAPAVKKIAKEKAAAAPQPKPAVEKTSKIGTKEHETRATFIVYEEQLEKLKAISYWERLLIKDVISDAFADFIAAYEKKHGKIKAVPVRGK